MKKLLFQKTFKFSFRLLFSIISIVILLYGRNITTPADFFGFKVGADFHLINYEEAVAYWKELAKESGRIKLFDYGESSEGRPMILAAISSEENIAKLDYLRQIAKRLSLVRGLSQAEAKKLALEGKAIVWIDGGLHATEVAPAQHIIQLSYDLLSDNSPRNKKILNEVITLLVLPNPDGMDMVAKWYKSNLQTPYETSPLPWLYQKYIGHDNNRDSFMLSVPETRNINQTVNHYWYPHIFYNHHQTSPFPSLIFVPPDCEPTNPNIHPLLLRWQNFIGSAIAMAFEAEGKQGVISRFLFDTWYPGYVTQVCDFHNIISTFSETFLYRYATPHFYTVNDFPPEYRDFTISMFFTNPWKGGWWHLRDAVEYCLTASKAVLDLAAKHRQELLYTKYAMGKETIEKFKKEPPFGWLIPPQQQDPVVTSQLINKLISLDIEIYQAESSFTAAGQEYPASTYILPTSQPFGRFLKTLFERQVYPDLRKYPSLWQGIVEPLSLKVPPLRTYDVLGWTLPLQMGIKTVQLDTPLKVKMKRIYKALKPQAKIIGSGSNVCLFPYKTNNTVIAINRLLRDGARILWAKKPYKIEGLNLGAGTFVISLKNYPLAKLEKLAKELSLTLVKIKHLPPSWPTYKLKWPRLAIYQPWTANIDEGWTRLILKNHEFSYTSIHNAEIKAGRLGQRFEVIIIPNISPDFIINGHAKGTMPPLYVGGISAKGVRNLKDFVGNGGTLITMGSSCNFALQQFNLPVKNTISNLKPDEFFASGLLLRTILDQNHPLAYGMPPETVCFFAQSPTFQILPVLNEKNKPQAVAKYPEENIIVSGWMLGDKYLKNKAGVVVVPWGKGKIILLGFRVQHRGQTVGTFKLLFNSILYGAAID